MNRRVGSDAHNHAEKFTKINDFIHRGGILIINSRHDPRATSSNASHKTSICRPSANRSPGTNTGHDARTNRANDRRHRSPSTPPNPITTPPGAQPTTNPSQLRPHPPRPTPPQPAPAPPRPAPSPSANAASTPAPSEDHPTAEGTPNPPPPSPAPHDPDEQPPHSPPTETNLASNRNPPHAPTGEPAHQTTHPTETSRSAPTPETHQQPQPQPLLKVDNSTTIPHVSQKCCKFFSRTNGR